MTQLEMSFDNEPISIMIIFIYTGICRIFKQEISGLLVCLFVVVRNAFINVIGCRGGLLSVFWILNC